MRLTTGALIAVLALGPGAPSLAAQAPRLLAFEQAVPGEGAAKLVHPVAVAAQSADVFVVADSGGAGGRLVRFRQESGAWSSDRIVELPGRPYDLAWDGERYAVSLRGAPALHFVEASALRLRAVPLPEGCLPGALAARAGGGFFLHDVAGRRLFRFDADGSIAARSPLEGRVTALAAGTSGDLFVVRAHRGTIQRLASDGREISTFEVPGAAPVPSWPAGVVAETGGELLIVDRHLHRLALLDSAGRLVGIGSRKGWEPGLLLFPAGLARLETGRYVVADQANGRAQIFRRTDLEAGP